MSPADIFTHPLGHAARDRITGFEGIITARVDYITGCRQYCLTPKAKPDGDLPTSHYFDEERIEVFGPAVPLTLMTNTQRGGASGPGTKAPTR